MSTVRSPVEPDVAPGRLQFGGGLRPAEGRWEGDRLIVAGVGAFRFRTDPCSGVPVLAGPAVFEPEAALPPWTRPVF